MKKGKLLLLTATLLITTAGAEASVANEAMLQKLITQIEVLTNRVNELESAAQNSHTQNAEQLELSAAYIKAHEALAWAERIRVKGDFRYRFENIDQEGKPGRDRQRIRARLAVIARPMDNLELGLGMASGGDDPVSTNQTLGGGGSTKGLNLDLAYFNYSGWLNTRIVAGKFKNILSQPGKSALLWDSDWNPEGFGLSWDNNDWFARLMGSWIESDTKKIDTEFSYVLQAGFKHDFGSGVRLATGLTYVNFDTAGKQPFFKDDFFGNSFNTDDNTYTHNYEELELVADLSFHLGKLPTSVYLDYVTNQDADAFDTGYAFGVKLGSAKSTGNWSFAWMYKHIEADAVFGLLTDSDFGGGGTDSKGHLLKGSYAVAKNWNANVSYFINEVDANLGTKKDFDRLQLDLSFKY